MDLTEAINNFSENQTSVLILSLERLRGVAKGQIEENLIFDFCSLFFQSINQCLIISNSPHVHYLISIFYSDFFEYQQDYLDETRLSALIMMVKDIVSVSQDNLLKDAYVLQKSPDTVKQHFAYKTLINLLKLLTFCCENVDYVLISYEVVLLGLSKILPLVSEENLKVRKIWFN